MLLHTYVTHLLPVISLYEFHIFPSFIIVMTPNCKSITHLLSLCMHMGISVGMCKYNTVDTFMYIQHQ